MNTRETLLTSALKVLEQEGEVRFSTRAVCVLANVKAPTLYHHFGSADGLLSAAMTEAFGQFLASKQASAQSPDPLTAMREGWDNYVSFAAARPRLYAAMLSRFVQGVSIPAAEQAWLHLIRQVEAIAAEGRLAVSVEAAADASWASANAAALLFVTARTRNAAPPEHAVINGLREQAVQAILKP